MTEKEKIRRREYYLKNKERINAYSREYQREWQKNKYHEDWEHREKLLKKQKNLKYTNPEKYFERLERQKAYYHAKKQLKKRD